MFETINTKKLEILDVIGQFNSNRELVGLDEAEILRGLAKKVLERSLQIEKIYWKQKSKVNHLAFCSCCHLLVHMEAKKCEYLKARPRISHKWCLSFTCLWIRGSW